jgi:hypothetical protein
MTPITVNRYQPNTLEAKLYTEGRVKRILKIKKADIEFIYPCEGGCLVGIWNDAVFIKKADFLALLSGDRKNRSKGLTVTQDAFNSDFFRVRNDSSNSLYLVSLEAKTVRCECKDWQNQSLDFNTEKVACKHSYAVLFALGYGSLKEYIEHSENRYKPSEYGLTEMAQGHY